MKQVPENWDNAERGQQGVDSRALLATLIRRLPELLILAAAGAVIASGIYLLVALVASRDAMYVSETEYYIEFAEGRYEARDYYNDFTWNDVIGTDLILGRAMELLGDGYDREQVKGMITADILSDVRYLTITVKGGDIERVERVKDAVQTALEEFGDKKREFDSIYKIEDLEIVKEQTPYFAWRAALLGAAVLLGAGLFRVISRFCVGSEFYTKTDVMTALGVPVYGMTLRGRGKPGSRGDKLAKRQDTLLIDGMMTLRERYKQVYLLDASGGRETDAFLQEMAKNNTIDLSWFKRYGSEQYDRESSVVAVIPFDVQYREKITDEINNARLHGAKIVGAILTGVDVKWALLYYGSDKEV